MTRQDINNALLQTSFLYGANGAYIEALQARYEKDPASVEPGWREFFDTLGDDPASVEKTAEGASWSRPHWPPTPKSDLINALDGDWPVAEKAIESKLRARVAAEPEAAADDEAIHRATRDSVRALMMIRAYRMRGHLHANLDPLGLEPQKDHEELHPASYGFQEADYDRPIFIDHVLGLETATVRQMMAILRRTYCSTIGFEFVHISDPQEKAWIQERIEGPDTEIQFTKEGKRAILTKLVEAEGFENFFDVKYSGAKRFGLDGAEAMIPALEQIIKRGGQLGLKEIALGMAHRGRLNVLSQVMGKPHRVIFHEFKGGSASNRRRTTKSCIRRPTASTRPTTTARFSSITCSGSNMRPCARCWRFCAAPIAAPSASSSCTSPIPPRSRGFRSASRDRTRRSSSPRKASAPSCRSWSRPRASRISSTSNIPAPSASASTAPRL